MNVCVQGCVGLSVQEGSVEVVVCLPTPPPGLWASPGGAPGCTEAGCVAVGPSVVHACFPLCPLLTFPLSTYGKWNPDEMETEWRFHRNEALPCSVQNLPANSESAQGNLVESVPFPVRCSALCDYMCLAANEFWNLNMVYTVLRTVIWFKVKLNSRRISSEVVLEVRNFRHRQQSWCVLAKVIWIAFCNISMWLYYLGNWGHALRVFI